MSVVPSREEAIRFMNGGAQADLDLAFRDGVVVDYAKDVVGDGNDLEIRIVFRHKTVLPPEPPEPQWVDTSHLGCPDYEEQLDVASGSHRHRRRVQTSMSDTWAVGEWASGPAPATS